MKNIKTLFLGLGILSLCLVSLKSVTAAPFTFDDGGASLQGILDDITVGGPSSVNVTTDALTDDGDSYWSITGSGGSISTIIIELAGNAGTNQFGIYDRNDSSNKVVLFEGSDSAGIYTGGSSSVGISDTGDVFVNFAFTGVSFAGNNFGYFLEDTHDPQNTKTWYSDTSLNNDAYDHMVAYQGKDIDTIKIADFASGLWTDNEYILAFEDLPSADSDGDYNDFVVIVESVQPVPEPGTVVLLGLGLVGLVGTGIKRKKRNKVST